MSKGIAIVSGGLDSITMVYKLLAEGHELEALSFAYGQRHAKEIDCANAILSDLGIKHEVIGLYDFGYAIAKSESVLTNHELKVPEGAYDAENMKSTVVPNRNMIMLSIAAGVAIARKGTFVATGVHAGDHAIYPDCRPEFLSAVHTTIMRANEGFIAPDFALDAPFMNKTKTDIARLAKELNVPVDRTWSCYNGGMFHCGMCGTCVERLEALTDAEVEDNTIYLNKDFWKGAVNR